MKSIKLSGITKTFGGRKILQDFDLFVEEGIFFALLGPSGCGKTTLLRMIAGLESADSGKIFLGNEEVTHKPAFQRKINTVFQQHGLFPHLTVFENVAYGLMIRGIAREEIQARVERQINIVNLTGLEKKYPSTLSGGQQQRVALARSLVLEPEVLLFDEPMSSLDPRLKERMLIECVALQHTFKTTFIYITHDRHEALTVADKLAIMNLEGKIEQIGSPREIYCKPKSCFVANFVGDVNIFTGKIISLDASVIFLDTDIGKISVQNHNYTFVFDGNSAFIAVRPEKVKISLEQMVGFANIIRAKVLNCIYSGMFMRYTFTVGNETSFLVFDNSLILKENDEVYIHFGIEDAVLMES